MSKPEIHNYENFQFSKKFSSKMTSDLSNNVVPIYRKGETMATYYAPPGEKYSKTKFTTLVKAIIKIMGGIEAWAAVAEPWVEDGVTRKSLWHMHIKMFFEGGKKKQITTSKQVRLAQLLRVPNVTHQYTTTLKKVAGIQKSVNDSLYASGRSVKDESYIGPSTGKRKTKTHFCVIQSSNFEEKIITTIKYLAEMKKKEHDLGGFDPTNPKTYTYALLKSGLSPAQVFRTAVKEDNINLEMYVVSNLQTLEQMSSNLAKIRAELEIIDAPQPPDNVAQAGIRVIENSEIVKKLKGRACPFYVDIHGGIGKSTWQTKMFKEKGAAEFPSAKAGDIAAAYNYEKDVCFNFTANCNPRKISYSTIEHMLDGKIFSGKYHSGLKRIPVPNVSVFMNSMPCFKRPDRDNGEIRWTMMPSRWQLVYFWNKDLQKWLHCPQDKEGIPRVPNRTDGTLPVDHTLTGYHQAVTANKKRKLKEVEDLTQKVFRIPFGNGFK